MTSKAIYPPIIGDGENTNPVKKPFGVDYSHNFVENTAAEAGVGLHYFSDLNALFYSDGDKYKQISPIHLISFTGKILLPSLAAANAATYSQSGNIVTVDNGVAHNIPDITYNGADVYLVPGTPTLGVAPTSDVANLFTDFQYLSATTFSFVATNSQTGTGAINSNNAFSQLTAISKLYPIGTIQEGDFISFAAALSNNNSAGVKSVYATLNGSALSLTTATTATGFIPGLLCAAFIATLTRIFTTNNPSSPITSINLETTAATMGVMLRCAAANDFVCLEGANITLNKAG